MQCCQTKTMLFWHHYYCTILITSCTFYSNKNGKINKWADQFSNFLWTVIEVPRYKIKKGYWICSMIYALIYAWNDVLQTSCNITTQKSKLSYWISTLQQAMPYKVHCKLILFFGKCVTFIYCYSVYKQTWHTSVTTKETTRQLQQTDIVQIYYIWYKLK